MTEPVDDINKDDEIINVRLPRSEYEMLRTILKRETAYSIVGKKLLNYWIYIVGGSALGVFAFWDKIVEKLS